MITRRDALLGGLLVAASGTAYALQPRRKMSLLGDAKLEKLIPAAFGGWTEIPSDALVVPEEEDSLAARLYSETVGRVYTNDQNETVMMLVAYGNTQSDQLQIHRPEVCYPAFGFELRGARTVQIPLALQVSIPGRSLTAVSNQRNEQIMYWTRIGEHLPATGREQRWVRLRSEMSGLLADGVLVRLSTLSIDPEVGFRLNQSFASSLVGAISPVARRALLGTAVAQSLPG